MVRVLSSPCSVDGSLSLHLPGTCTTTKKKKCATIRIRNQCSPNSWNLRVFSGSCWNRRGKEAWNALFLRVNSATVCILWLCSSSGRHKDGERVRRVRQGWNRARKFIGLEAWGTIAPATRYYASYPTILYSTMCRSCFQMKIQSNMLTYYRGLKSSFSLKKT